MEIFVVEVLNQGQSWRWLQWWQELVAYIDYSRDRRIDSVQIAIFHRLGKLGLYRRLGW